MGKLSRSELVRKLSEKAFKECDCDKTGQIDVKELHIGLLLVYDKMNKALPVYLKPPSHDEVHKLMAKYDVDGSGHLSFEEFHKCVEAMVGLNENVSFTESLPFKVLTKMAVKMVILPLAVWGIKALAGEIGGSKTKKVVDKVPNAVLVPAVEGVGKLAWVTLQQ